MRLLGKNVFIYFLFFIFVICTSSTFPKKDGEYVVKQISCTNGLSNSAVLSIYRDDAGLMWFGSYDGLNRYDGNSMRVFRINQYYENVMLNNSIYDVTGTNDNILWLSTTTGMNLYSVEEDKFVGSHRINTEFFKIYSDKKDKNFLIVKDKLYFYNSISKTFDKIPTEDFSISREKSFLDRSGRLWMYSDTDNCFHVCQLQDSKTPQINSNTQPSSTSSTENHFTINKVSVHDQKINYVYHQLGMCIIVDEKGDLFLYDLTNRTKIYIRKLSNILAKYGEISGIAMSQNDIFIGLKHNGVIRLDGENQFKEEFVQKSVGVFTMYKDPIQDIVWVGTDGMGVLAIYKNQSKFRHFIYSMNNITKQVRSIYVDDADNLWFGTKGDGLVKIDDYKSIDFITNKKQDVNLTVYKIGEKVALKDYTGDANELQVFEIYKGSKSNGLWIGAEKYPALAYYNPDLDSLLPISGYEDSISKVHGIYEQNDTTLWLAMSGKGLCEIGVNKKEKKITSYKNFEIKGEDGQIINDFFPMDVQGDSLLWLGSRGSGLVRFNIKNHNYKRFLFKDKALFPMNDILCILRKENKFYLGTVAGIIYFEIVDDEITSTKVIGHKGEFPNNMVHGLVIDNEGYIWASTNKGLIKYKPGDNEIYQTYYRSGGLRIDEFSDDAFYCDEKDGTVFFGGVNGLMFIEHDGMDSSDYVSDLLFMDIRCDGESILPKLNSSSEQSLASPRQINISGKRANLYINYVTPDMINADNYTFSHKLEGYDSDWSSYTYNNEIKYSSLPYGNYSLKVKYKVDAFNEKEFYSNFDFELVPPWFIKTWVRVLVLCLLLSLFAYFAYLVRKIYYKNRLLKNLINCEQNGRNNIGLNHEMVSQLSMLMRLISNIKRSSNLSPVLQKKLRATYENISEIILHYDVSNTNDVSILFNKKSNYGYKMSLSHLSSEIKELLRNEGNKHIDNIKTKFKGKDEVVVPISFKYFIYSIYKNISFSGELAKIEFVRGEKDLKITIFGNEKLAQAILKYSSTSSDEYKSFSSKFAANQFYKYALESLEVEVFSSKQSGGDLILFHIPEVDYSVLETSAALTKKSTKDDVLNVLILDDKDQMKWLYTDLLGEEYELSFVPTIQ